MSLSSLSTQLCWMTRPKVVRFRKTVGVTLLRSTTTSLSSARASSMSPMLPATSLMSGSLARLMEKATSSAVRLSPL